MRPGFEVTVRICLSSAIVALLSTSKETLALPRAGNGSGYERWVGEATVLLVPVVAFLTAFFFCKGTACHLSLAGGEHFWQFRWHHFRVEPPLPTRQNKLHRVQRGPGLPIPRVSWLSPVCIHAAWSPFWRIGPRLITSVTEIIHWFD